MERQKGSFPLGNSKISDGFISERATNSYNFDLAVNRMRIAGSILVLLIASQLLAVVVARSITSATFSVESVDTYNSVGGGFTYNQCVSEWSVPGPIGEVSLLVASVILNFDGPLFNFATEISTWSAGYQAYMTNLAFNCSNKIYSSQNSSFNTMTLGPRADPVGDLISIYDGDSPDGASVNNTFSAIVLLETRTEDFTSDGFPESLSECSVIIGGLSGSASDAPSTFISPLLQEIDPPQCNLSVVTALQASTTTALNALNITQILQGKAGQLLNGQFGLPVTRACLAVIKGLMQTVDVVNTITTASCLHTQYYSHNPVCGNSSWTVEQYAEGCYNLSSEVVNDPCCSKCFGFQTCCASAPRQYTDQILLPNVTAVADTCNTPKRIGGIINAVNVGPPCMTNDDDDDFSLSFLPLVSCNTAYGLDRTPQGNCTTDADCTGNLTCNGDRCVVSQSDANWNYANCIVNGLSSSAKTTLMAYFSNSTSTWQDALLNEILSGYCTGPNLDRDACESYSNCNWNTNIHTAAQCNVIDGYCSSNGAYGTYQQDVALFPSTCALLGLQPSDCLDAMGVPVASTGACVIPTTNRSDCINAKYCTLSDDLNSCYGLCTSNASTLAACTTQGGSWNSNLNMCTFTASFSGQCDFNWNYPRVWTDGVNSTMCNGSTCVSSEWGLATGNPDDCVVHNTSTPVGTCSVACGSTCVAAAWLDLDASQCFDPTRVAANCSTTYDSNFGCAYYGACASPYVLVNASTYCSTRSEKRFDCDGLLSCSREYIQCKTQAECEAAGQCYASDFSGYNSYCVVDKYPNSTSSCYNRGYSFSLNALGCVDQSATQTTCNGTWVPAVYYANQAQCNALTGYCYRSDMYGMRSDPSTCPSCGYIYEATSWQAGVWTEVVYSTVPYVWKRPAMTSAGAHWVYNQVDLSFLYQVFQTEVNNEISNFYRSQIKCQSDWFFSILKAAACDCAEHQSGCFSNVTTAVQVYSAVISPDVAAVVSAQNINLYVPAGTFKTNGTVILTVSYADGTYIAELVTSDSKKRADSSPAGEYVAPIKIQGQLVGYMTGDGGQFQSTPDPSGPITFCLAEDPKYINPSNFTYPDFAIEDANGDLVLQQLPCIVDSDKGICCNITGHDMYYAVRKSSANPAADIAAAAAPSSGSGVNLAAAIAIPVVLVVVFAAVGVVIFIVIRRRRASKVHVNLPN